MKALVQAVLAIILVGLAGFIGFSLAGKKKDSESPNKVLTEVLQQEYKTSVAPEVVIPESGEATGIVTAVYTKSGKNYIDIDYITFRNGPGDMPGGSIVNDSSKIRTFEVASSSSILLHNQIIKGKLTSGEYKVSFVEFFKIFSTPENDIRELNPWDITVKDGVIIRIEEHFRS